MKRAFLIAGAAMLLLVSFLLGDSIHAQYRQPIQYVIFVSDRQDHAAGEILAWSARRVLLNLRPTGVDISELNGDAGARHIAKLNDRTFALELLRRFSDKGLNLEALDPSGQWTALQSVAIEGNAAAVQFLLANGAQIKRESMKGESLLNVLRRTSKNELNGQYQEIIRILGLEN